ncbi:MAG: 16S rRNA (guanine(527)-N(7))-methyltransferase RsmG [Sulfurospirillaceae bacterium]|nr:16S rRNA (guanine(527)-N(7))-methyltransferase RsmG [Sulfurospirillaceae bacterium]MDD3463452.1 16S rRNA (guanine(527)-N(7))-methyltransferase RsmG [Sulfurospirillaceae bacterium]
MKSLEEKQILFTSLVLKYNKTHNITGAKNTNDIEKNIQDSLFPLTFLETKSTQKIVDIGSGAGFPGLVLAMALPDTHFYLFEPIAKKSAFLHLAKTVIELNNVSIFTQRIEDAEPFEADIICSRAVTQTQTLINLCQKFISKKTILLLYKGERVVDELPKNGEYEIHKKDKRNYLTIKGLL